MCSAQHLAGAQENDDSSWFLSCHTSPVNSKVMYLVSYFISLLDSTEVANICLLPNSWSPITFLLPAKSMICHPQLFCFSKYQLPLSSCSGHKLWSFISFYLPHSASYPLTNNHALLKTSSAHCYIHDISHLPYCCSLQSGLLAYTLTLLQSIPNTASGIFLSKYCQIMSSLCLKLIPESL